MVTAVIAKSSQQITFWISLIMPWRYTIKNSYLKSDLAYGINNLYCEVSRAYHELWHPLKCGVKLRILSLTSTVQSLRFENGYSNYIPQFTGHNYDDLSQNYADGSPLVCFFVVWYTQFAPIHVYFNGTRKGSNPKYYGCINRTNQLTVDKNNNETKHKRTMCIVLGYTECRNGHFQIH